MKKNKNKKEICNICNDEMRYVKYEKHAEWECKNPKCENCIMIPLYS